MDQSYAIGKVPAPAPTISDAGVRPASSRPSRPRCHLAVGSTGHAHSQEIGCLLRYRLFLAALITGIAFSIFFIRRLLDGLDAPGVRGLDVAWQGGMSAFLVFFAVLFGSRVQLSVRLLRILELVLFGTTALYFAWMQLAVHQRGMVLEWANPEHLGEVVRMANTRNTLRWFILIVIYGTFVPNTWKRCAFFVGLLTLTPLVISCLTMFGCPYLGPHLGQALVDATVVLGIASAVAIFGSYRISELSQEAYEARQLGQYRLKRRLGSGGMGEVYLGEHVLLRRACAIKLIRPDQAGDRTALQRFEREVKAMAALTHWNTVEIYDYGHSDDGTFYYVMEYLPGLSLQELVSRHGPLPPARAIHFLRQVCGALQEAHANGVIHRDIKPSNVIACERGGIADVAKLLDFGLVQCTGMAAVDSRLTMQGTILGSPPYMSPEQAQGKEHLDARSDIYSFGSLAYFLLTGRAPFVRETAMQVLMAQVYEPVTPLAEQRPDVPTDLADVIMRCLEKDPARRYPDIETLDEALATCAEAGQWTRRQAAAWWQSVSEAAVSTADLWGATGEGASPVLAGAEPNEAGV